MGAETALVPTSTTAIEIAIPGERARAYREKHGTKSPATLRAYVTDWRTFTAWMNARALPTLPSDYRAIEDYVTHLAEEGSPGTEGKPSRVSSIERALASIAHHHRQAGIEWFPPLFLRETMKAIRRDLKVAPKKKKAVTIEILRSIVAAAQSPRDRAIVLLGWNGAMRRSEVVKLDVSDITFEPEGLTITLRGSKTDQEGHGETIGIHKAKRDPILCPMVALRAHLDTSGIAEGPIFRNRSGGRLSGEAVAELVQRLAKRAGFENAEELFGGHSLRSGLATSAAKAGKGERSVMRHGRWRNEKVARGYYQIATVFEDNPTEDLL